MNPQRLELPRIPRLADVCPSLPCQMESSVSADLPPSSWVSPLVLGQPSPSPSVRLSLLPEQVYAGGCGKRSLLFLKTAMARKGTSCYSKPPGFGVFSRLLCFRWRWKQIALVGIIPFVFRRIFSSVFGLCRDKPETCSGKETRPRRAT